MRRLVLSTRNQHKVAEIKALMAGLPFEVVPISEYPGAPEVEEDGNTFKANAAKKAEAIASFTGQWTIADDSGLEVDFLGGKPGVYSARFAGEDASDAENNAKLLALLKDVPMDKRGAAFVSVIAIARPGEETLFAEGRCPGYVGTEARGFNGFGYDPLFYLPEKDKTYSELSPEEKNQISHRALAMHKAREILAELIEG